MTALSNTVVIAAKVKEEMRLMTKATIDDVAELAGVSMKTVSRVVNQEPNVRASTREKVEAAIKTLNYRPNQSARNLASHRSHLIALIYDDPSAYDIPSSGYVILASKKLRYVRARGARAGPSRPPILSVLSSDTF